MKLLYGFAAFVFAGVLLFAAWELGVKGSIERSIEAKMQGKANEEAVQSAEAEVQRVDTIYRTVTQAYPVYRDRIIRENPGNRPLEELATRCDQIVLTCEDRVRAGNNLADSLRKQVADLKAQKKVSAPRFSAFAEGLYDFIGKEPVIRGGGEMRVIGPLSLTAAAETSAGMDDSRQRVLVGARFTFR